MTRTHGNIGGTSVAGIVLGVVVAGGVFLGVRQLMPCSSCSVPGSDTATPGAGVVPAAHAIDTAEQAAPTENDAVEEAEEGAEKTAEGGCCPLCTDGDKGEGEG